jgi:hypothetical protein
MLLISVYFQDVNIRNDYKEKFRAKARFFGQLLNPGLKSGVIDNEMFADFSPKFIYFQPDGYKVNY